MQTEIIGIIIAIFSAVFIGLSNLLFKKSYKEFTPALGFLIMSTFTLIIWTIVGYLFGVNWENLPKAFLFGLVSATLAQGVWIYILSKGELSITSTVMSSYPIYTILLSFLFLDEKLTVLQYAFIAVNILGVIIISLPQKISRKDIVNFTYIAWPLIGAISVGASDTLSKAVITDLDIGTYLFGLALAHLPIALAYYILSGEKFSQIKAIRREFNAYKFSIYGGLFSSLGALFIFTSFEYAPASIASPVTATSPIPTVIMAVLFLKEKLSYKDIMGIILVMIGILGVSLNI